MRYKSSGPQQPSLLPPLPPYAPPMDPFVTYLLADEDVVFLDKPSGLLTVPGKSEAMADCLEARVNARYPSATIVHRLDMETSGVIVMARHKDAHRALSAQFEMRQTEKTYEALVWGELTAESGEIDQPLICDWPRRPLQKICPETGKKAVTTFRLLGHETAPIGGGICSRVALTPVTGRSHQLRVHIAHLGYPILGDRLYARHIPAAVAAIPRMALHAKSLSLLHPEKKERLMIAAPLPF